MTRMRRAVGAMLVALAAAGLPALASAHPLGNFSINHHATVTVSVDRILVDLVIDVAEIPTIELVAGLDTDRDGAAASAELAAGARPACHSRADELAVTLDGLAVQVGLVDAAMELRPGAAGLPTLRTACVLEGHFGPLRSTSVLVVADGGDEDRIGWREIVVRGDGVAVLAPDAGVDNSDRLRAYPEDRLQQPLDERSVEVGVRPGGPAAASVPGAEGTTPVPASGPWAVDLRALTPAVAALGLLLAAAAGAGHALTPGHGKTLMAAYLVGTRGRPRDALLLGMAVTVSHTAGVLGLAGIVLVAGSTLPADRLYPILSAVSGAIVIGIGGWLLVGCLRRRRHDLAHARAGGHAHAHEHGHEHPHPHRAPMGRGGVLAIGLAGGMIPSPAALVLLLGAIAAGQPAYGVALAIAFGAGMAVVLVGIGLLIVHGRTRLTGLAGRLPSLVRLAPAVPWVAALVVLAGGVALTGGAVAAI